MSCLLCDVIFFADNAASQKHVAEKGASGLVLFCLLIHNFGKVEAF